MAHNLAISIRAFGGELSQAPIVVNFVDGVDRTFAEPLEALGAEVRIVQRVSAANPLANKLRMLELQHERQFEVLIALDCDIVVVGDLRAWLDPASISAKAADFDRLTDEEWRGLFAALDLPLPEKTLTATATGQRTYPYFNSGVLFVPHALCDRLRESWMSTFEDVGAALARNPSLIREQWQWLAEQASLSLAILRSELPWRALPTELNLPSHVRLPPSALNGPPVIVHYHSDSDPRGFLLRSATATVDPWLDDFNCRRSAVTGLAYTGLARRPAKQRVRRAAARRLWALVADRGWYRSPRAMRARRALKRAARAG